MPSSAIDELNELQLLPSVPYVPPAAKPVSVGHSIGREERLGAAVPFKYDPPVVKPIVGHTHTAHQLNPPLQQSCLPCIPPTYPPMTTSTCLSRMVA
jgi:hypothetical protein